MNHYLVIGLGRFGRSIAKTLYENGAHVLAIDDNEEIVQNAIDNGIVDEALSLDAVDEKVLKSIVKDNFETAFVCIGSNIQSSILVTLNLKEIGVSKVIAKATTKVQGKVLSRIGADEIIYPEEFMGERVAMKELQPNIIEHFKISNDYSIVELESPSSFIGSSLIELDLRRRYNVNVIGIKLPDDTLEMNPSVDRKIEKGDTLILIVGSNDIGKLDKMK